MIPPPNPVIDAMAAEWVRTVRPLDDEEIHAIAVLLQPDPAFENRNPQAA